MEPSAIIERVRRHCLAKPSAFEDHPSGETVIKVKSPNKIFCFGGGADPVITVKATLEEQAALIQHPNIIVAANVGRVTVSRVDEETLELDIDLIDKSYDYIAPKKKLAKGSK